MLVNLIYRETPTTYNKAGWYTVCCDARFSGLWAETIHDLRQGLCEINARRLTLGLELLNVAA